MMSEMSTREFIEWATFYTKEPFGDLRGDIQAGIIASTIANANRNPKKRREMFKIMDFIPRFWETSLDKHKENIKNFFAWKQIFDAINAKNKDKE